MEQNNQLATQDANPIRSFFATEGVTRKFKDILGNKAQGFITSVLQVVNGSDQLSKVSPVSIFNAAATAAVLDLPINQNLGFAWIVPYKGQAQFQIGYKGFIQLAQRSGQYEKLNMLPVYANQFNSWNDLTETLDADFEKDGQGEIVGYAAYFKLINGYSKTVYWSKAKVIEHAKRFSKNFNGETSTWKSDFDTMAMKTVLKNMLSRWGILSIEMQKAINVDQAVIKDEEGNTVEYVDNNETIQDKSDKAVDQTLSGMRSMISGAKKGGNK